MNQYKISVNLGMKIILPASKTMTWKSKHLSSPNLSTLLFYNHHMRNRLISISQYNLLIVSTTHNKVENQIRFQVYFEYTYSTQRLTNTYGINIIERLKNQAFTVTSDNKPQTIKIIPNCLGLEICFPI